jgi:uncharacterized protein YicC (UPF0701 family)
MLLQSFETRIGTLETKIEEVLERQSNLDTANSAQLIARLGEVVNEVNNEAQLNAMLSQQVSEMRELFDDVKARVEDLEAK